MNSAMGLRRRLDRAISLGVLGAVLLAVVGMGEARAAIIAPPDRDADPTDDLIRRTGDVEGGEDGGGGEVTAPAVYEACVGLFGVGKLILEFGDELRGDFDGISVEFGSPLDDDEDFSAIGGVLADDGTQVGVLLQMIDEAACESFLEAGDPPGSDAAAAAAGFDPDFGRFPFTLTVTREGRRDLVCEAEIGPILWLAVLGDEEPDDGDVGLVLLWTAAGGAQAFEGLAALEDALLDLFGPDEAAFSGAPVDCTVSSPAVAPVSTLALACEPAAVAPGAVVTCTVSGGVPDIEILWRASASPAFAGQGVLLDADGRGSFSFRVPPSVGAGPVLVELVEWDRTATVALSAPLLPARIPAGEGMPAGPGALLGFVLLGGAALRGRRRALAG